MAARCDSCRHLEKAGSVCPARPPSGRAASRRQRRHGIPTTEAARASVAALLTSPTDASAARGTTRARRSGEGSTGHGRGSSTGGARPSFPASGTHHLAIAAALGPIHRPAGGSAQRPTEHRNQPSLQFGSEPDRKHGRDGSGVESSGKSRVRTHTKGDASKVSRAPKGHIPRSLTVRSDKRRADYKSNQSSCDDISRR
ncbi:unnamed protein product [Miscanthus lutarioriparius]|uniref:Uncharacterized protein n=1 Tax=Miscanthus lutarioriparius TaxID=422564 RepID=A0A811MI23_9POAL|nr:unnamed protein product [Miscanthus lutarioriparius]